MDSFVLLAYVSLAASRTLLQRLLACLNFTLESEDLSFWYKWKKWLGEMGKKEWETNIRQLCIKNKHLFDCIYFSAAV